MFDGTPGGRQFFKRVFRDELEAIRRRREVWNLPEPGGASDMPAGSPEEEASGGEVVPDPSHGTVGLALSGGGIRSATFNLGVLQVFAKRGLLRWFDYLSTVSGGGYIGSHLSGLLRAEDPGKQRPGYSLVHRHGVPEPEDLRHLRSGQHYLAPHGLLDILRIPAILVRGIIINLLVLLPLVGILSFLTAFLYEDALRPTAQVEYFWPWLPWEDGSLAFFFVTPWPALALLVWIVLFPLVSSLFPHAKYRWRTFYEASFAFLLLLVLATPLVEVLPWFYRMVFLHFDNWLESGHLLLGAAAGSAGLAPLLQTFFSRAQEKGAGSSPWLAALRAALMSLLGALVVLCLYLALTRLLYTESGTPHEHPDGSWMLGVGAVLVALYLFTRFFVDVNKSGMHRFYRDRLSAAYLYDPFRKAALDELRLSQLEVGSSGAPYHLVNTALNVQATRERDLQGRKADFFCFSPLWSGSFLTGYCPTPRLEEADRSLTLATAFSVSGAAAAPNMGTSASKTMAFLLTLFNVRLDYWMRNPRYLDADRRSPTRLLRWWLFSVGPVYLLMELLGLLTARHPLINLSDGGHIENLGLYELIRRRCRYIVCCDAERDPDLVLPSLGKLTAYARMDEGIRIEWANLDDLALDERGRSRRHWAYGTIDYGDGRHGEIVYLKSSLTGDEPRDLRAYRAEHPDFPHESTADQFFDESQFESYRALGYHVASEVWGDDESEEVPDVAAWFAARREDSSTG